MRYKQNRSWLPEDDDVLKQLVAQGISAVLVAVRMKRNITGVKKRAHDLGMPFPSLNEYRIRNGMKPKGEWRTV